jgi:ArsR family transcriptional regulator
VEKLINFLKLLSDETRLRIMVLLHHQELCVCELCGVMDISQPNVSKHLAKIRDMGFVKDERREQYVFYSLNIEDEVFQNILNDIVANIEDYQVLKNDIEKSKYVEKYLESCKSGGGNCHERGTK